MLAVLPNKRAQREMPWLKLKHLPPGCNISYLISRNIRFIMPCTSFCGRCFLCWEILDLGISSSRKPSPPMASVIFPGFPKPVCAGCEGPRLGPCVSRAPFWPSFWLASPSRTNKPLDQGNMSIQRMDFPSWTVCWVLKIPECSPWMAYSPPASVHLESWPRSWWTHAEGCWEVAGQWLFAAGEKLGYAVWGVHVQVCWRSQFRMELGLQSQWGWARGISDKVGR